MMAQGIIESYCEDEGIDSTDVSDEVWNEVESQIDNMMDEIINHEWSNGAFNLELQKIKKSLSVTKVK